MFRLGNFLLQLGTLMAFTYVNWYFPKAHDLEVKDRARERGWGTFALFITRAVQHFTIFSAWLLVFALFALATASVFDSGANPLLAVFFAVTHSLQTAVGVLYHILVSVEPFYLLPRVNFPVKNGRAIVKTLVSFVPPYRVFSSMAIWCILHIQHTLAPLYLWLDIWLFDDEWRLARRHELAVETELAIVSTVLLLYGVWNMFCWYVRREPVYPIQQMVWERGWGATVAFYCGVFAVMLLCAFAARTYRDRYGLHTTSTEDVNTVIA